MNRTRTALTAALVALTASACVYVPPSPWSPSPARESVPATTTTEAPRQIHRNGRWIEVPAAEYPTTPAPAPKPVYPTVGA